MRRSVMGRPNLSERDISLQNKKPKSAIGFGRRTEVAHGEPQTVSFPKRGCNPIPRREARAFPPAPSFSAAFTKNSSSGPLDFSPLGSEDRRNKLILRCPAHVRNWHRLGARSARGAY